MLIQLSSKRYPCPQSVDIRPITFLYGENGVGKTYTMRLITKAITRQGISDPVMWNHPTAFMTEKAAIKWLDVAVLIPLATISLVESHQEILLTRTMNRIRHGVIPANPVMILLLEDYEGKPILRIPEEQINRLQPNRGPGRNDHIRHSTGHQGVPYADLDSFCGLHRRNSDSRVCR